jgi:hypothetical protein
VLDVARMRSRAHKPFTWRDGRHFAVDQGGGVGGPRRLRTVRWSLTCINVPAQCHV